MDMYSQKKADDVRRDKVDQPRRELHVYLQEYLKRQHGVKKVVHQKSWQLVESLNYHAAADKLVAMFSDFLDGTRDVHELSFYLYCSSVFTIAIAEESSTVPPARFLEGYISFSRASAILDLLFGHLAKPLGVLKQELEKVCVLDRSAVCAVRAHLEEQGSGCSPEYVNTVAKTTQCVLAEELFEILLEGWRMSALQLDEGIPGFSWRRVVLAFIQSDTCHRGWLDPHEVCDAERRRLLADMNCSTVLGDRTSFGAFVWRAVQRSKPPDGSVSAMPPASGPGASSRPRGPVEKRKLAQRKAAEASLKVTSAAFASLDQSLEVYLTWMMHSEELRDLAVYRAVKAQIYNFNQSLSSGGASQGAHSLRSLLLLLLAHQFDVQYQQEDTSPQHLDWELRSLLKVLRESWRRRALAGDAPEALQSEFEATDDQEAVTSEGLQGFSTLRLEAAS
jgi:hypothetical protein